MRQRGAIGWFKHDVTHRGPTAWVLAAIFAAFYFYLYFGGQTLFGFEIENRVQHFARNVGGALGLSKSFSNKWTLYGLLYTLAITGGGIYVLRKYRHNAYQIVRTGVVMVTQISLGFSVPLFLKAIGQPEYYFSYFWPLKIEYFYPQTLASLPVYMAAYSVLGSMVLVPVLSIWFGKRWYCSWICGCGGLANTFGDPFRHLSNKSNAAWRFEKVSIHGTLVVSLVFTAVLGLSFIVGPEHEALHSAAIEFRKLYTMIVVATLSGLVGVAAYPIGGTRVWCRYFCPMAAMIGLIQKFGRFRITVKENMCISCGLCSKYCEMGIDVRAYAQRNQSFVRASCVGCGLCAEVCPRGVLRLENKWDRDPQELHMNSLLSESYKRDPHRKAA
jgi:ferredoxin